MEGLKDIFDKISSYNIFNNLLPGILFAFIGKEITEYDLIQENNLIGAFLYYFIGMVVSRFGSIIIEPFLKWIKFLKFSDYKSFVIASRKDSKIELLSEVNNSYRTLLSMSVLLVVLKVYSNLKNACNITNNASAIFAVVSIFLLFLFSYRKQTNYITKRIEANKD